LILDLRDKTVDEKNTKKRNNLSLVDSPLYADYFDAVIHFNFLEVRQIGYQVQISFTRT